MGTFGSKDSKKQENHSCARSRLSRRYGPIKGTASNDNKLGVGYLLERFQQTQ